MGTTNARISNASFTSKKQYKGILSEVEQENLITIYHSILKEQPVLSAEQKEKKTNACSKFMESLRQI